LGGMVWELGFRAKGVSFRFSVKDLRVKGLGVSV